MKWALGLLLLGAWIIGCAAPVFALGSGGPRIGELQTGAFPNNSFALTWTDPQGHFVADLKAEEIAIREDGSAVETTGAQLQTRGVQFGLAVNAGPGMGPVTSSAQPGGQTQLDAARAALEPWLAAQQGAQDEYSLATNTGLQLIRSRTSAQLVNELKMYQPDFFKTQTNLFSFTTLVDLAAEPTAGAQAAQPAILFITPPLGEAELKGLVDPAARAAQHGVVVFIWLVVPDASTVPAGLLELQNLADSTGGRLALVSTGSPFPDLESWLRPLRQVYRINYRSAVRSSGTHSVSVQIQRGGQSLAADQELRYQIDLRPPNPMFISPPLSLALNWEQPDRQQPAQLNPASVPLEVLVEFPDQLTRPLKATRLFVDDQLAAENTAAPFERFEWALGAEPVSGMVQLRVEAEDTLELIGSSIELPVSLTVAEKPSNSLLARFSTQGMIAVGAVLLAGLVLALVVVGENRLRARQRGRGGRHDKDPVTQPVAIRQEIPSRPRKTSVPSWPKIEKAPPAPARMVRLTETETAAPGSPIAVSRPEMTFGSDAHLVVVTVEDASVNPVHARLTRSLDGDFMLSDEGSIAGTWVNYVQINGRGKRLHHGDLVHMGRVMFRFELSHPAPQPEAVVSLVEDQP